MFDNTTLEMTNMLKYVTILRIKYFPIPGQVYKFRKFIGMFLPWWVEFHGYGLPFPK